jgi:hypothetical protein
MNKKTAFIARAKLSAKMALTKAFNVINVLPVGSDLRAGIG